MRIILVTALVLSAPVWAGAERPTGARSAAPAAEMRPGQDEPADPERKKHPGATLQQVPQDRGGLSPAMQRAPKNPSLGPAVQKPPGVQEPTFGDFALKLPDLRVTTQAPSGSSTYYNFTIRNDGAGEAAPMVFEISLGPPCNPNASIMTQRKVLERFDIKALKPTVSSSMAHKVGHDLGGLSGTGCTLIGEVDADGNVVEANEQNNQAAIGTPYTPTPDLTLTFDWDVKKFGVKNVGDATAGASVLYMHCHSGQQMVVAGNAFWPCKPHDPIGEKTWTWSVPALAPGQQHLVTFPPTSSNPPNTVWHAYADHGQSVVERNEDNNHASNLD